MRSTPDQNPDASTEPLRLSPTVEAVREKLTSEGELHAIRIVESILERHPEYAPDAKLPRSTSQDAATPMANVEQWLELAANAYDRGAVSELHGRLVVIGLALADEPTADLLERHEVLSPLVGQIKEPLPDLMTSAAWKRFADRFPSIATPTEHHRDATDETSAEGARGKAEPQKGRRGSRRKTKEAESTAPESQTTKTRSKPRPAAGTRSTDAVPTHGDHPAARDELGRRAFARVVATRIRAVREQENWPDGKQTVTRSGFGFLLEKVTALVERLRRSAQAERDPMPRQSGAFMLHIHGPWGAGKTTLLNFIRDELAPSLADSSAAQAKRSAPADDWIVVYFNAWRYQRLGTPWWALMTELQRQARLQLARDDRRRARELFDAQIWWRVFTGFGPYIIGGGALLWLIALLGFDFLKDASQLITAGGVIWTAGRYVLLGTARGTSAVMEIAGDPLRPLISHFRDIVWRCGRPVVVFVDDLDRCDSDYVARLLQGIKTLFWDTRVVYVVAADRHWLRAAYENTYEKFADYVGEPGRPLGYLFLEKIFQMSVSVPALSGHLQQQFFDRIVGLSHRELDQALDETATEARERLAGKESVQEILAAVDKSNRAGIDPLLKHKIREEAAVRMSRKSSEEEEIEHQLSPFVPLLEPNPRAMKRMVNAYGVRRAIDLLAGRHTPTPVLARWTIMELRWPLLAEQLSIHPEQVAWIRSGKPPPKEIAEPLASLHADPGVREVVAGRGYGKSLTVEAIRACTGLHPADPTSSAVA